MLNVLSLPPPWMYGAAIHCQRVWIWWQSTGLGVERQTTFCHIQAFRWQAWVLLSFLTVKHHFIYSQKMAGSLQPLWIPEKLYKYPINNSDPVLADMSKFWHLARLSLMRRALWVLYGAILLKQNVMQSQLTPWRALCHTAVRINQTWNGNLIMKALRLSSQPSQGVNS